MREKKLTERQLDLLSRLSDTEWTDVFLMNPPVYMRTMWSLKDKGLLDVKMENGGYFAKRIK